MGFFTPNVYEYHDKQNRQWVRKKPGQASGRDPVPSPAKANRPPSRRSEYDDLPERLSQQVTLVDPRGYVANAPRQDSHHPSRRPSYAQGKQTRDELPPLDVHGGARPTPRADYGEEPPSRRASYAQGKHLRDELSNLHIHRGDAAAHPAPSRSRTHPQSQYTPQAPANIFTIAPPSHHDSKHPSLRHESRHVSRHESKGAPPPSRGMSRRESTAQGPPPSRAIERLAPVGGSKKGHDYEEIRREVSRFPESAGSARRR